MVFFALFVRWKRLRGYAYRVEGPDEQALSDTLTRFLAGGLKSGIQPLLNIGPPAGAVELKPQNPVGLINNAIVFQTPLPKTQRLLREQVSNLRYIPPFT